MKVNIFLTRGINAIECREKDDNLDLGMDIVPGIMSSSGQVNADDTLVK